MDTIQAKVSKRLLSKADRLFTGTLDGRIIEILKNAMRAGATEVTITNKKGLCYKSLDYSSLGTHLLSVYRKYTKSQGCNYHNGSDKTTEGDPRLSQRHRRGRVDSNGVGCIRPGTCSIPEITRMGLRKYDRS